DEEAKFISLEIEGWFNDRMARASGWYKRRMQAWSFGIACAVTLTFNADSIHAVDRLWKDGALRDSLVATAQAYHDAQVATTPAAAAAAPPDVLEKATEVVKAARELHDAGLPIGWQRQIDWSKEWFTIALGWFVTALAVSLGSGFWFDVLSKVL